MCGNQNKKEESFMIADNHNVLNKIGYLIEELSNDDTLFEMVKNHVASCDNNPHKYTSQSQQMVEEIISTKTDILKLLVSCAEKERLLKTTTPIEKGEDNE